jgi:NitT/TauT family transport system substrate-binding protein
MRFKTRPSLFFIAPLSTLAFAFGLAATSSPAVAADAIVRIGTASVSSDAGFFIADKKGYFKKEGITVTFTTFNSAAKMVAPLGAGQLDVGGGTVAAGLYNAVGRDIDIKIVADKGSIQPGYGFSALMVRKDLVDSGRYKSYSDLKGMNVAIGASGTGTASALNEALKKGGLKYSEVNVVDLGFPQHVPAFTNKAIDASITNEPTVSIAVKRGIAVRVAGNDIIYPGQQTAVVLYSGEFIRLQPLVARKFMRAYIKGVRDYNDALKDGKLAGKKAEEVIAILTEYTNIKDADVYRSIIPNACNPDGRVNADSLRKDYAFFQEQGLIKGKVEFKDVFDSSFVEAAVRELGPYKKAN